MKFHKYTEEELIEAVKESTSLRQVLIKLNVKAAGGNYEVLKKAIKYLELDTSHFTGQLWNKGKTIGPKVPIEEYLSNKRSITSHKLRQRLISEKIFPAQCNYCKNTEWNSLPIPLELEHINGNHQDNSLDNLELLCPNCHAQTATYRGKNIGKCP